MPFTNQWIGPDFRDHRKAVANRWLRGSGIEIGGLHKPLALPVGSSAKYVDLRTHDEGSKLNQHEVLVPDLVANGFILDVVEDNSLDFIIGNHLLEHCPDLVGALDRWISKLRPGGVIYAALPIVDRCFDNGRPVTPISHFFDEHVAFTSCRIEKVVDFTRSHLIEFALTSGRNILRKKGIDVYPGYDEVYLFADKLVDDLHKSLLKLRVLAWDGLIASHGSCINMRYDLHYHTFTPRSVEELFAGFCDCRAAEVLELRKSGGGECIGVIRKLN